MSVTLERHFHYCFHLSIDGKDDFLRIKRASPHNSQQQLVQTVSEVKLLIKEELRLMQTKSVLKMKQFASQDQKVTLDDGENQDTEEDQAPQGDSGQRDLLVNMDQ